MHAVLPGCSGELMPYERCIFYTVVLAVVALDRPTLKSKVGIAGSGAPRLLAGFCQQAERLLACCLQHVEHWWRPSGAAGSPLAARASLAGTRSEACAPTLPSVLLVIYCTAPFKQVIDSPEVLSVIDSLPHLRPFVASLYDCRYAAFFQVGWANRWSTFCCGAPVDCNFAGLIFQPIPPGLFVVNDTACCSAADPSS